MKPSVLTFLVLLFTNVSSAEIICQIDESNTGTIQILSLGDFSCDGHCKTDETTICSSLSAKDFSKAYALGTKRVGFNFEDVADEYEEATISKEQVAALQAQKINLSEVEIDKNGSASLYAENYIDIYLQIVRLGNEKFKYKTAKSYSRIGGYGLFE